jgi:hypothetical protein
LGTRVPEADALIASVCDIEITLRIEADAQWTIQLGALGGTIPAQARARAGDHLDRPSLQVCTTNLYYGTRFAIQHSIACARQLLLASIHDLPGLFALLALDKR